MKNITVFFWLCLFFFSCKNSTSYDNYDFDTKTIRWNVDKAFEIKDIVKDMHYILLEETSESIFSEIYKLIIKNDRIYILDIMPKALLVFDINGDISNEKGFG